MRRRIRRPSPAMVVACLALLVALGGTSVAAVSQLVPRNSVGTAQIRNSAVTNPKIRNNAVNSTKVANRSLRAVDFAAGQIPAGPPGAQGATGPQGPAGPAGATGPAGAVTRLTAVVNSSGSLARSQGTTSAGRVVAGGYEVIFNQDVTNCTYLASTGNPASGTPARRDRGRGRTRRERQRRLRRDVRRRRCAVRPLVPRGRHLLAQHGAGGASLRLHRRLASAP